MKRIYIWFIASFMALSMSISSCVDQIAFGNAFLEKAPGGDATEDSIFNSAEYTRQFLNAMYSWQYYGLPWQSAKNFPYGHNYWTGSVSYLTDCYHGMWSSSGIYKAWYTGGYNATSGMERCLCPFIENNVWYTVRAGWKLIERIEGVPGLSDAEKKEMVAQAKCLMADGYYQVFRHYGGLPLVRQAYQGTESSYDVPRATVEETVNFIVNLLDEAAKDLPWGYDPSNTVSGNYDNAENDMGHWTRAGAMALKCKVLLFAASPLFNADKAYAGGNSEAEQQFLVWYGGYKQELWDKCYESCKAFFDELNTKGYYRLETAPSLDATIGQYRAAFRRAYFDRASKEVIHSTRVTNTYFSGNYFNKAGRIGLPTFEYMEKFAWADGRPFDWDKAEADGELNEIFVKWANADVEAKYDVKNATLTRDPRLYETIRANGVPRSLSSDGTLSGEPYEVWVSGRDAGTNQETQGGQWGTGFSNNKFFADDTYSSTPAHWPALRLSDLMLTYAEAKLQSKNDYAGAIDLVDQVRARVGLGSLKEFYPMDVLSDSGQLLELILNERSCELGFEDSRFYDLVRYKRDDVFKKPLHVLMTYRLDKDGNIVKERWYGNDQNANKPFPSRFKYDIQLIRTGARVWWSSKDDKGNIIESKFEPKWLLSAIKQTEIEKGYLIQNPGW